MDRLELMPPPFRQEYEDWIQQHQRTGGPERRRRLRNGLGHAELSFLGQVWLPAVGRLTNLHPEYEVADYSGAPRFLDFAYLRGGVKLAIEIDGFHAHVVDMDRTKFANDLHRQNLLTLDGWDILRFAYDDVESRPRRCQQTLQQYMGSRFATDVHLPHAPERAPRLTAIHREIIRLARSLPRPLTPADVRHHLGVGRVTAYQHLRSLTEQGLLIPASGTQRIRSYKLSRRAAYLPF